MYLIFRHKGDLYYTESPEAVPKKVKKYESVTLTRALLLFLIFSTLIFVGGFWITRVAVQIAELYGWTHSFVGTLFLAFVTSLPEFTVSFRAAQLGLYDMAVASFVVALALRLVPQEVISRVRRKVYGNRR